MKSLGILSVRDLLQALPEKRLLGSLTAGSRLKLERPDPRTGLATSYQSEDRSAVEQKPTLLEHLARIPKPDSPDRQLPSTLPIVNAAQGQGFVRIPWCAIRLNYPCPNPIV
jgi:hypothetical protein